MKDEGRKATPKGGALRSTPVNVGRPSRTVAQQKRSSTTNKTSNLRHIFRENLRRHTLDNFLLLSFSVRCRASRKNAVLWAFHRATVNKWWKLSRNIWSKQWPCKGMFSLRFHFVVVFIPFYDGSERVAWVGGWWVVELWNS